MNPKSPFDGDERPPDDGRDTESQLFLTYLLDLLADNVFRKARPTLEGIYATVERTGAVTRNQRQAVRNIVREFTRVH
jgi:hypothetical protein